MSGGGARTAARGAALVLVLAALVLFPRQPCTGADSCPGVTAVVDFGALGGGVQERCVADGAGQPAWQVFEEAGFPLTPVQQFPDAVCRVSGQPASDPCVRMPPANAYWGLFWSTGGGWVYSTKGPRSLTAPAGGSLGFAWQNSTTQRAPGVPASSAVSPSPSPSTSDRPTRKPTRKPATAPSASATASASAGPTASATPTASGSAAATPVPTPVPTSEPTTAGPVAASEPEDTTPAADSDGGGLAWWVPVVVLVALAAAGGGVWWRRRGTT